MRIDPGLNNGIQNADNAAQTQITDRIGSDQHAQALTNGDQVDLSGASNLVSLSAGMVSAARAAKISNLTAQVQSGQYQVDAAQLASSLVDSMLSQ